VCSLPRHECLSLTLLLPDYMNGFKCNVTSSTSSVPIAKSQVPRRCGADPLNKVLAAAPGNCTYGAKQPFYWFNQEQNNVRPASLRAKYRSVF
jgi:hypothetical protein